MASTGKTPHFDLPQFVGTDKPSWLGDFNGAMLSIDTALFDIKTDAEDAATSSASAQASAQNAATSAETAQTAAETATTEVAKVKTDLSSTQQEVTTLSTAQTGMQTNITQLQGDVTQLQTNVQQAQTTASAASQAASNAQTGVNALRNKNGAGIPYFYPFTPQYTTLTTMIEVGQDSSNFILMVHTSGIIQVTQNTYVRTQILLPSIKGTVSCTMYQSYISIDLSTTSISTYKYNSMQQSTISLTSGNIVTITWTNAVDLNKEYLFNGYATIEIPKTGIKD